MIYKVVEDSQMFTVFLNEKAIKDHGIELPEEYGPFKIEGVGCYKPRHGSLYYRLDRKTALFDKKVPIKQVFIDRIVAKTKIPLSLPRQLGVYKLGKATGVLSRLEIDPHYSWRISATILRDMLELHARLLKGVIEPVEVWEEGKCHKGNFTF